MTSFHLKFVRYKLRIYHAHSTSLFKLAWFFGGRGAETQITSWHPHTKNKNTLKTNKTHNKKKKQTKIKRPCVLHACSPLGKKFIASSTNFQLLRRFKESITCLRKIVFFLHTNKTSWYNKVPRNPYQQWHCVFKNAVPIYRSKPFKY